VYTLLSPCGRSMVGERSPLVGDRWPARIFCELRGGVAGGELGTESSPPHRGLCSGLYAGPEARRGGACMACPGCWSLHLMMG